MSAVVLDDARLVGHATIEAGDEGRSVAHRALEQALAQAGHQPRAGIEVVATGCGRGNVVFAGRTASEVTCQAKGARWLFPAARTVLNIGGESIRAIQLNEAGRAVSFFSNDKCAAGSGVFLSAMARALQVSLDDMGRLALAADGIEEVSSRCMVFAESEVVSHIHRGVPAGRIIAGLHKAVVDRVLDLLGRTEVRREVVLTGGVARNGAIVRQLEDALGLPVSVPAAPQICGALGAALLALEAVRGRQARPFR